MATPSRLNNGLATHYPEHPLGFYPLPDPFETSASSTASNPIGIATYATDYFDVGNVTTFTVTGGSSTFAASSGLGGFAVMTPGGATTATVMYRNLLNFQFIAGQQLWFKQRIIPGLFATTGTYAFGLQFGSATTDGLWFTKPASSTNINLVSTVASTATTLATAVSTHAVGSLAAGATTQYTTACTCTSTAGLLVGQYVFGTGIQIGTTVTAVTSATAFTISIPATATNSGLTIIYSSAIDVAFYYNGVDLTVWANNNRIARISAPTIADVNTANLTSVGLNHFMSCTPTATDLIYTDYVLVAEEFQR